MTGITSQETPYVSQVSVELDKLVNKEYKNGKVETMFRDALNIAFYIGKEKQHETKKMTQKKERELLDQMDEQHVKSKSTWIRNSSLIKIGIEVGAQAMTKNSPGQLGGILFSRGLEAQNNYWQKSENGTHGLHENRIANIRSKLESTRQSAQSAGYEASKFIEEAKRVDQIAHDGFSQAAQAA